MRKTIGCVLGAVIAMHATTARAESNAAQCAGWTIAGVGSAMGAGSLGSGLVLLMGDHADSNRGLATASIAGGAATIFVALAAGLSLAAISSKGEKVRSEALLRAASGEIRF